MYIHNCTLKWDFEKLSSVPLNLTASYNKGTKFKVGMINDQGQPKYRYYNQFYILENQISNPKEG